MTSHRILYGASFPNTVVAFLSGQMKFMTTAGFDVHLVAPDLNGVVAGICRDEGVTFHPVDIRREPHPLHDLIALRKLLWVVKQVAPDTIIVGTPKASILMLLAGALLRVKRRVYLCHGLRYEGLSGTKRALLIRAERLMGALSTEVVAVSHSVRQGLINCGVPERKVIVLGSGSPNGVDTDFFSPPSVAERKIVRSRLGLNDDKFVILFVGRLTFDKGIRFLSALVEGHEHRRLLVAGRPEPVSDDDRLVLDNLRKLPNVSLLAMRDDVRDLCRAADVLILPTLREGLPTVVIEASATGLPVVAMKATGTVDAIRNGKTGILVDQGDSDGLVAAIDALEADPLMRQRMSHEGRVFAINNFARATVWRNWAHFLQK